MSKDNEPEPQRQPKTAPKPNPKRDLRGVDFETAIADKKEISRQKQELLDSLLEDAGNFKKYTDYDAPLEHLDVLRRTICQGLTNAEFYYYLQVCHQLGLDPYLKQVWCYKDYKNNLITIVGRDGYLVHCEKQPDFKGLTSAVIYAGDEFIPDYVNNKPEIHRSLDFENRNKIIGAWALCRREGIDDRFVTVYFDEYRKSDKDWSPWTTNPSAMITKVAELEAMRKQFPLSGIQNEHDWTVDDKGIVKPVDKPKNVQRANEPVIKDFQRQLISLLSEYKGDDADKIRKQIISDKKAGLLNQAAFIHYKSLLTNDTKNEEE